jgi:PKD repeat protein
MTPHILRQVLWLTLLLLGNVVTLGWASPARAADPLTPVIGVNPQALDFGVLEPGACRDEFVQLRNAADDGQSQLVITQLTVTAPFALVEPPDLPLTLPGDGATIVVLTIRYCASGSGPQNGALTIVAARASNSPRIVPITGVSNIPPKCDAGGPYSGVTGAPITMTGAGSSDPDGTIVAYRWDFGDGQTGSGATPTHIYTAPGTFDIELTVTDNWEVSRACATSAEVATVSLPLSPVIGVNPIAIDFGTRCPGACQDAMVSVRNAVNDPQSRLVISDLVVTPPFALVDPPPIPLIILGDGSQIHLTLRYCAPGSGPEMGSLAIHANATNSPLTVPLSGTADPPPQCAAGGPYFGQPNQPIAFDGRGSSDPGGAIVSYTWDFGDGATGTGPAPTHSYGLKSTYGVALTVADACGSTTSCQTTAVVSNNLLPICDAGGPYAGFTGTPIVMSGAGSSDPDGVIVDYQWDFGDGKTGTGVAPSHIYSGPASTRWRSRWSTTRGRGPAAPPPPRWTPKAYRTIHPCVTAADLTGQRSVDRSPSTVLAHRIPTASSLPTPGTSATARPPPAPRRVTPIPPRGFSEFRCR